VVFSAVNLGRRPGGTSAKEAAMKRVRIFFANEHYFTDSLCTESMKRILHLVRERILSFLNEELLNRHDFEMQTEVLDGENGPFLRLECQPPILFNRLCILFFQFLRKHLPELHCRNLLQIVEEDEE
jgi:hypothetical protein